jgi:aconitate hydratase
VFPADAQVRAFLAAEGREDAFIELLPDADAMYDMVEEIDLSTLEPLIALPGSPGNVVPVREVAGRDVAQVVVGSSANPGFRDVAVVAAVLDGRQAHFGVSLDINPASRQILQNMASAGVTASLVASGARLHQTGCLGCIGMGQAPAAGSISLRTFPRNFRGRSGTPDDAVYLCSPETAAAAALTGRITDPRDLPEAWGITYPTIDEPARSVINTAMFEPPLPIDEAAAVPIVKGSNIVDLPPFEPLADRIEAPVGLVAGHDVSTDEILPPGDQVLPFRSNIPRLADYVFARIDEGYVERVRATRQSVGHVIVAGSNYGQGSSREHAVLAPRYLGLKAVIAVSFARIHWQNLTSFGVLPLEFIDPASYAAIAPGDVLRLTDLRRQVLERAPIEVVNLTSGQTCDVRHRLSDRQIEVILAGGLIPWLRAARLADPSAHADTPGSA